MLGPECRRARCLDRQHPHGSPAEARSSPRRLHGPLLRRRSWTISCFLLAKDPGATYNHKIISIEHVLPQNPTKGSQWPSDFTDEDREGLTHRLGMSS